MPSHLTNLLFPEIQLKNRRDLQLSNCYRLFTQTASLRKEIIEHKKKTIVTYEQLRNARLQTAYLIAARRRFRN